MNLNHQLVSTRRLLDATPSPLHQPLNDAIKVVRRDRGKGRRSVVEASGVLVMKAHRGIPPDLMQMCHQVPVGKCLCGQAGATRKLVFAARG